MIRDFTKKIAAAKSATLVASITDLKPFVEAHPGCAIAMHPDIDGDAKLSTQLTKKFDSLYKEESLLLVSVVPIPPQP